MKTNHIYQGDSLEVLKTFPDGCIDMVMTSPPYWALRDYGTANWEGGDENCDHVEIIANIRDCSGGFSGRDKGTRGNQPSAKTSKKQYIDQCKKCGAKRIDKQLGLEPTFDEYINKLCDIFDEVKRVLKKEGTIYVNLGDTYSSGNRGEERADPMNKKARVDKFNLPNRNGCGVADKCLVQIPSRFAIEMTNRGWILRNTIIWKKNNCMPSSAKDRFTVDFEYIFFFSKSKKYYFEQQLEPVKLVSLERVNYGLNQTECKEQAVNVQNLKKMDERFVNPLARNKRTTWTINPKPFSEAHFAIYPEELCITPIKASCPEKGIVLDPFFGAGTTGLVALKQNKKFIGIELNQEYIEIAEKRLKPWIGQSKIMDFEMQ